MVITAKMVKDLRDSTGAGMMDAKTALVESNGDFEAASDWLKQKGLVKAQKKSGRIAAEGVIGVRVDRGNASIVEVNCETDFVAKNSEFQEMVRSLLEASKNVVIKNAHKIISQIRLHKEEYEINNLTKAVEVAEKALNSTLDFVKEGLTEVEIKSFLMQQLLKYIVGIFLMVWKTIKKKLKQYILL